MDILHSAVNKWIVNASNAGKRLEDKNPERAVAVEKLTTNLDSVVNSNDFQELVAKDRLAKIRIFFDRLSEGSLSGIGVDFGIIGPADSYSVDGLKDDLARQLYEIVF